jgi:hypothetical protein
MTHTNNHLPQQHSVVTEIVIATLTGAMIVLAGLLSLSQFAVVVA